MKNSCLYIHIKSFALLNFHCHFPKDFISRRSLLMKSSKSYIVTTFFYRKFSLCFLCDNVLCREYYLNHLLKIIMNHFSSQNCTLANALIFVAYVITCWSCICSIYSMSFQLSCTEWVCNAHLQQQTNKLVRIKWCNDRCL